MGVKQREQRNHCGDDANRRPQPHGVIDKFCRALSRVLVRP